MYGLKEFYRNDSCVMLDGSYVNCRKLACSLGFKVLAQYGAILEFDGSHVVYGSDVVTIELTLDGKSYAGMMKKGRGYWSMVLPSSIFVS